MNGFKMPTRITPGHRTSSITNSFTNGLMPQIEPTDDEVQLVLSKFNQNSGEELRCVYCNEIATEWDHFHPLIHNKRPTGYITEIYNLVPCCHTCNSSKGSKEWEDYLKSTSKASARTRLNKEKQTHLIEPQGSLYENLKSFEKWSNKKIHQFKFEYNDTEEVIIKIELTKGTKTVHKIEDRFMNNLAEYYAKLIDINNLLIAVANDSNNLTKALEEIVNTY